MNLLHYGLQRSGTNFLETLIKQKYRVRLLNRNEDRSSPLQKHFRLYNDKDIIPEPQYRNNYIISGFEDFERLLGTTPDYYLIISKDPYSWFLSYNNWAKKCSWPNVSHHYIMEYNLFYKKWLEFSRQTEKIIFIRYLNLLQNANEELGFLESQIGLRKTFFAQFRSSTIDKVAQSGQFSNDRRNYYLSEKYLESYNKKDLQTINSLLDPEVISQLGYEKKKAI